MNNDKAICPICKNKLKEHRRILSLNVSTCLPNRNANIIYDSSLSESNLKAAKMENYSSCKFSGYVTCLYKRFEE
jgi:hypothetical protein